MPVAEMVPPFVFPPSNNFLPALGAGDVHLWCAGQDLPPAAAARLESLLSDEERGRAAAFRFPADRLRFVAGRGLLRVVLSRYLGQAPEEVRFSAGPGGKPGLAGGKPSGIEFNLSHSKTLVLYAFARDRQVGVDVEDLHPVPQAEAILRRYFAPADREAYAAAPAERRPELFLELWTKREAYLKGCGRGLAGLDGSPAAALPAEGWQLVQFRPAPGRVAALACAGEIGRVSAWEIPESWTREEKVSRFD
jgi:4'-phosphopantetheinyl transferase